MALSAKRRVFVEEYLKCWNGAEAARRAGYAFPRRRASVLLTNDDIKALIEERLVAMALDTNEVLSRLGEQGRGDWSQYIRITPVSHEPWLDIDQMREDGKLHLIKGFTVSDKGNVKIEGYCSQSALVHIGKHLGMFKTTVEHSGPGGGAIPVEIQQLARMTDDKLRAEQSRLAAELASSDDADEAAGAEAVADAAADLDTQPRATDGGPPY